jgi:hypothetical protein
MQWSDVIKAPSQKTLRQFAGLSLVVFGGLAAWRMWHGQTGLLTQGMAVFAVVVGGVGLIAPALVRPIYTGWMILAFPIGWTVSQIALGLTFFLVFVPVGAIFRIIRRDALRIKRAQHESYWTAKPAAKSGEEYLRQF